MGLPVHCSYNRQVSILFLVTGEIDSLNVSLAEERLHVVLVVGQELLLDLLLRLHKVLLGLSLFPLEKGVRAVWLFRYKS